MTDTDSATARLVACVHARYAPRDREAAARVLLDTMAVGIGAFAHEPLQIRALASLFAGGASGGPATALGFRSGLPPALAGAANAIATHAIDYDDTYMEGGVKTHISAVVVPAALAMAEAVDASGLALLDAIVAGFETEARLGHMVTPAMVKRWHPTGTLGPIGAAAAAARLMELTPEQTEQALGIAADAAAGTRVCLAQGDATKSLHAAWAVRSGIEAAQFVAAGTPGPRRFFETADGFFSSYVGGQADGGWGPAGARIHDTSVKFYPAMHALHAAIAALIEIAREHPVRKAAEIDSFVVVQSTTHARFGTARDPQTTLGARLSLPYTAAVTLLDGACGFAQYARARLFEPELRALMGKLRIEASDALEKSHPDRIASEVIVRFADGSEIRRFAADPKGTPGDPPDFAEVAAKSRDLLMPVGGDAASARFIAAIGALSRDRMSARALAAIMPQPA